MFLGLFYSFQTISFMCVFIPCILSCYSQTCALPFSPWDVLFGNGLGIFLALLPKQKPQVEAEHFWCKKKLLLGGTLSVCWQSLRGMVFFVLPCLQCLKHKTTCFFPLPRFLLGIPVLSHGLFSLSRNQESHTSARVRAQEPLSSHNFCPQHDWYQGYRNNQNLSSSSTSPMSLELGRTRASKDAPPARKPPPARHHPVAPEKKKIYVICKI